MDLGYISDAFTRRVNIKKSDPTIDPAQDDQSQVLEGSVVLLECKEPGHIFTASNFESRLFYTCNKTNWNVDDPNLCPQKEEFCSKPNHQTCELSGCKKLAENFQVDNQMLFLVFSNRKALLDIEIENNTRMCDVCENTTMMGDERFWIHSLTFYQFLCF